MCGIAGWFSGWPACPEAGTRLARMVDAIAHRGPDGRGTLTGAHFAFGHARLAIIDLQSGAQPMTSTDGALSIIHNGEIYNYAELAAELRRAGQAFATRSDTEVILNTYRVHGVRGFARLRGMFAFALWDRRLACGWLVRDRYGIKPLFHTADADGGLVFASEAKALLPVLGTRPSLDVEALHLLMNFRYPPGPRTLFRGITQLAPGTVLCWTPNGVRTTTLGDYPDDRGLGPGAALEDSVRAHLTADVEVATYLSGGIDSAAIAALARRHTRGPLRGFTVDVGDDPREAEHAARSAQLLDIESVRAEPTDSEAATAWPRLVWHLETPKVNAWQVAVVAQATARHVKVALSGLGGDELFYGYNLHRHLYLAARAAPWLPRPLRRASARLAVVLPVLGLPRWSEPERVLRAWAAIGDWAGVYGLLRNVWDDVERRPLLYGPRLLDTQLPDAFDVIRAAWPRDPDPLRAVAHYERREKMVNDLLWQEDRLGMACGLEVRVPFVDPVLTAAVDALPRTELMPGGFLKGYLRRMLGGVLPAEILQRPKSGFQVNAVQFFHTRLGALAREYLSEGAVRRHGLFNPAFVRAVLGRRPHPGLRWHYFMLYLMLGAHLWLELFERGRAPDQLTPAAAQ